MHIHRVDANVVEVSTERLGQGTYRVVVRGELGDQFEFLFDGMEMSRHDGTTVLTGPVADQAHLAGILARTQELGLDLISVAVVEDAPGHRGPHP